MLDKILEFLNYYLCDIPELIKQYGKYRILSEGLKSLIRHGIFTDDKLRKELSLYIKRIVSEHEFNELLDKTRVEYARILL